MPIQPSPLTWTLRFKCHRTTVLLHVEQTQTFASIKAELLTALLETNPDGTLNGLPIPKSADAVLLARPVDSNDLQLGWESLDDVVQDEEMFEDETKKGKGKGKSKGSFKDCPLGSGLRDGSAVAFRFRSAGDDAARDTVEEDETMGLEDTAKVDWDVVIPSYEDVYGLEEMEAEQDGAS